LTGSALIDWLSEVFMKCYRCGWCGQPTKENGEPLELWQIAVMDPFVDWENVTGQTNGYCCQHQNEMQQVQVTREMAMDAGEPEMEGMWINW
jgi:hypothetical protein